MTLNANQKKKIKISIRLIYLCLILMPLLVVSTYTWFSLSKTPRVSDMDYSVSCGTGMELAFDPLSADEEWTQFLDFGTREAVSTVLKPVTWSNENQSFYAAEYGMDGRIAGITKKLTDEANANKDTAEGYYIKRTFYARTGEPVSVSLSPAVVGADGTEGSGTYLIGTPEWNGETIVHDNGGLGFEYAIRVGLRITTLEADGITPSEDSVFYIYEPNCDGHIVRNSLGEVELLEADPGLEERQYRTFSIDGDGTSQLIEEDYLIQQTTSTWTEAYPVQREVIIQDLGDFLTEPWLFELEADGMAQIDLYIWLEGQDVDCSSLIGQDARLFLNIQFQAIADTGSGLEPIR